MLQFQAELAVAHAAVAARLPEDWAAQHGFVGLKTRVADHREFLLRPDLGRRLDDASLAELRAKRTAKPDVQLIVADGLSAVACMGSGKALHDAVARACQARGLTVGTPVAARFARVWLEDEIGHEIGAKVAMILLGERPGLGTGDGLSAYVVYEPRLGKTDGDRNMISNIHARGIPIEDAARRLAALAAGDDRAEDQRRRPRPRAARRIGGARAATAAGAAEARGARAMILEPIVPTVLAVRRLPHADPAMMRAYGGDPARHTSLGLVTSIRTIRRTSRSTRRPSTRRST